MSARRLEEILEECLSAYLDGRRSVEESLSLYPSFAPQLEPLLRTATSINTTLNAYSPPAHVQERGLHRFLSDARARQNLKSLKVSGSRPSWLSVTWQKYRLGFAGAGMAVLILTASVGGAALMNTGSGGDQVSDQRPDSATPAVVIALQEKVNTIRTLRANQSLTEGDIRALLAAAQELENASDDEIGSARDSVEQALNDANAVVSEIIQTQDPELAPSAQEASEKVREVAANLGVTLSPTPVVTAPPASDTPTTEPTAPPTPEPTAPPTAEPTAPPTEVPTVAPEATEPPPRVPAVIE